MSDLLGALASQERGRRTPSPAPRLLREERGALVCSVGTAIMLPLVPRCLAFPLRCEAKCHRRSPRGTLCRSARLCGNLRRRCRRCTLRPQLRGVLVSLLLLLLLAHVSQLVLHSSFKAGRVQCGAEVELDPRPRCCVHLHLSRPMLRATAVRHCRSRERAALPHDSCAGPHQPLSPRCSKRVPPQRR